MNNIEEIKEVSGRIIMITMDAAGGDIHFISAYAPPADHPLKEKEKFYEQLATTIRGAKGICYCGGDFNARIYEVLEHEKGSIGKHIIGRKGYITAQEKGHVINKKTKEN